mgnify:CR=1 FL=1|tara:strand:+ start:254 stop:583 length:330 start_codon:yes stop_codon:yes gene_type:complete
MKKLLLIALLIVGCDNHLISNVSSLLIDIFVLDDNCKSIIYKYNDLQKEHKKLIIEYEQIKDSNDASEDVLEDYKDRILDLSFQIDDQRRILNLCNGGKTINYINSSYN